MKTNLTLACLTLLILHAACDKKPRPAGETPAGETPAEPAPPQGRPRPDRPVDDPEPFKALAGIYVTADFFRVDSLRGSARENLGKTIEFPDIMTNPDGTISIPKCKDITDQQMEEWGWIRSISGLNIHDKTQVYASVRSRAVDEWNYTKNVLVLKSDGSVKYGYIPYAMPKEQITEADITPIEESKLTMYQSGLISDCESGRKDWKGSNPLAYLNFTLQDGMLVGQTPQLHGGGDYVWCTFFFINISKS